RSLLATWHDLAGIIGWPVCTSPCERRLAVPRQEGNSNGRSGGVRVRPAPLLCWSRPAHHAHFRGRASARTPLDRWGSRRDRQCADRRVPRFERSARGGHRGRQESAREVGSRVVLDRKSTRLNSSHVKVSYAVVCLKKKILPLK